MSEIPYKSPNDPLFASEINALARTKAKVDSSRPGSSLCGISNGSFAGVAARQSWHQYTMEVQHQLTDDNDDLVPFEYHVRYRYYDHGDKHWLTHSRDWEMDASDLGGEYEEGDLVVCWWNAQRNKFIPVTSDYSRPLEEVSGESSSPGYPTRYHPQLTFVGMIVMWSGTLATIPAGWHLCDGTNGTPDLRGRFILGVDTGNDPLDDEDAIGDTGGYRWHGETQNNHTDHMNHRHQLDATTITTVMVTAGGGDGVMAVAPAPWTSGADNMAGEAGNVLLHQGALNGGRDTDNRPRFYVLAFIMRIV